MFLAFIRLLTSCGFTNNEMTKEEIQKRRLRILPLYGRNQSNTIYKK